MSVIVYKAGGSLIIDHTLINQYIEGGWSLDQSEANNPTLPEPDPEEYNTKDVPESVDLHEEENHIDTISGMDEDELRILGKEAGIRNWHNMRIDNLRKKLME